jgi:hypothetical protein
MKQSLTADTICQRPASDVNGLEGMKELAGSNDVMNNNTEWTIDQ